MIYHLAIHPFLALCEDAPNTAAGVTTTEMTIVDCEDCLAIIDDVAEKAGIVRPKDTKQGDN